MKTAMRNAILQAKMRSIRRELDNLETLRAQQQLEPVEKPDDTYVMLTIRGREGKLLNDLERLSGILEPQYAN